MRLTLTPVRIAPHATSTTRILRTGQIHGMNPTIRPRSTELPDMSTILRQCTIAMIRMALLPSGLRTMIICLCMSIILTSSRGRCRGQHTLMATALATSSTLAQSITE
jgi:hypothetical protein